MIQQLRDLEHPELQPFRRLYGAKGAVHPEAGPCFICEGRFLVDEALAAGREGRLQVVSVLAAPHLIPQLEEEIPQNSKLFSVDEEMLARVVDFKFHRGVLACVAVPPEPPEELVLQARRLLVLPRLDDQENLGLLLRSAAALGMDAVLLGKGPGLFERRTVRVSMGAVWKLPVLRREDPAPLLERWRHASPSRASEIVGAALAEGAMDARDWVPVERSALVLGPEGPGLDARWRQLCDRCVRIPMAPGVDSLNVAAAGAILMFRGLR